MKELQPIQKRRVAGLTAALLLTLSVGAALTSRAEAPIEFGAGTGPWINSSYGDECESPNVCAEWPDDFTNISKVCCIKPETLETYQPDGCEQFIAFITNRVVN